MFHFLCYFMYNLWFNFTEGTPVSNFMKIGLFVQKLSRFYEFQDGGRHVEFLFFDKFMYILWFSFTEETPGSNFMKIGPLVQKLSRFYEFQDGGRRHLGFHFFAILCTLYGLVSRKELPFQIS